ncbi:hypothetical protein COLO4_36518 [Corchorus olitorius]|uniref:DUF4216 domain-containing protein n=1 Tax=Corchorus olitorius TaxID=93759 RepID=A0A1R3G8F5_9ROSI|nr:hypothetical protein COLO4_36518 [Corchorus olitorius]
MNSGVCVPSSNGDFYGLHEEIIQLEYSNIIPISVVLFKCQWFDPRKGVRVHHKYGLVEINRKQMYRKYDPFILAHQAMQVYYTGYPSLKRDRVDWMVMCKIKPRRTIEARWQAKDDTAYQMDEVEAIPVVTTFDVLPPLHDPNTDELDVMLATMEGDEISSDEDEFEEEDDEDDVNDDEDEEGF